MKWVGRDRGLYEVGGGEMEGCMKCVGRDRGMYEVGGER